MVDNTCLAAFWTEAKDARSHGTNIAAVFGATFLISSIVDSDALEFRAATYMQEGLCLAKFRHVALPIPVLPRYVIFKLSCYFLSRLTSCHKNDFSRQVWDVRLDVEVFRRMAHSYRKKDN